MKKLLSTAFRWLGLAFVIIWILAMLIALIAGPFVEATAKDTLIYRIEVLWAFLTPAVATIYWINPKGLFNRMGRNRLQKKRHAIAYFTCAIVLVSGGFSAIDAQHSEQYLVAFQESNKNQTEPTLAPPAVSETIQTEPSSTTSVEEAKPDEAEKTEGEDSILNIELPDNTNTPSVPSEEDITAGRFVGTDGYTFSVVDSFDCDGIIYEIHSVKIKSDRDSELKSYNFYEIFFDFTIRNERNVPVNWNLAYNGNLYGLLCHRGVTGKLGGNNNIKDSDFSHMKLCSSGTLAPGDSLDAYRSLVCMPYTGNYSDDTWPLYSNEPFSLELHLVVDDIDYILAIDFNQ